MIPIVEREIALAAERVDRILTAILTADVARTPTTAAAITRSVSAAVRTGVIPSLLQPMVRKLLRPQQRA